MWEGSGDGTANNSLVVREHSSIVDEARLHKHSFVCLRQQLRGPKKSSHFRTDSFFLHERRSKKIKKKCESAGFRTQDLLGVNETANVS